MQSPEISGFPGHNAALFIDAHEYSGGFIQSVVVRRNRHIRADTRVLRHCCRYFTGLVLAGGGEAVGCCGWAGITVAKGGHALIPLQQCGHGGGHILTTHDSAKPEGVVCSKVQVTGLITGEKGITRDEQFVQHCKVVHE